MMAKRRFGSLSSAVLVGLVDACRPASTPSPPVLVDSSASVSRLRHPATEPVDGGLNAVVLDATLERATPRTSCAYAEATQGAFPEDATFSAKLDELRREPRDPAWAARAEAHLEKARQGAGDEGWRLLECRQSACVVGLISNAQLYQRLADLPWGGASGSQVHLRRDGCHEVFYTFWRHPRDYAGAPGGRVASTQQFTCASGRPPKSDSVDGGWPCTHFYRGMCFASSEALCACVCSVFPNAKPRCIAGAGTERGQSLGCTDTTLEFGRKWPP